ncbi:hypothetical protein [Macrococcus armenti]|uniref:Uncharacterized protein n=1 Tax=Macrococcus armenti TaxID=2875764 RepID=A0ABY3ZVG4_9STAP|nr:hypothetical protein [Macrococcus armenti]UOB20890.1 hypothetical protein MRZ06_02075 [Macrococcus armenti]
MLLINESLTRKQYKQLIELVSVYANSVLFVVPYYIEFEDEPFYKKFQHRLMSTKNTDNWIGTKKPKIEMEYRYYWDEDVIRYFLKFDNLIQMNDEKTPLLFRDTDVTFLKFNEVIVETISHEQQIFVAHEVVIETLKNAGVSFL